MPCGHHSHSSLLLTPPHPPPPHQLPCHWAWLHWPQDPEHTQGGRDDLGNHREGVCGYHSETILGDNRAPRGLRSSQSHHIQGHKYAILFDPVTPLFGIPPKDIIARERAIRAQLFIATLFIIVKSGTSQKACSLWKGGHGASTRQKTYYTAKKNGKLGKVLVG